MWNRNDPKAAAPATGREPMTAAPPRATTPAAGDARPSATPSPPAVIGPSISIRGDLTGDEDLIIEGRVEGEVLLKQHQVSIGAGGRLKANVQAKQVHVAGRVEGDLTGEEEVVIRRSGSVAGNITAPRVTLEDGCKFRGSVSMGVADAQGAPASKDRTAERKGGAPAPRSPPSATPSRSAAG